MKISIKSSPEDFQVQELICEKPRVKGKFGLYAMTKRGWNTVDALRMISRSLKIPSSLFHYGGKKDRHAVTKQFITIEYPQPLHYQDETISIQHLGFIDRAMGPDLILANRFTINVRGLRHDVHELAVRQLRIIAADGFVNYFDDQRFGGWDPTNGFLGEKILKEHYNGAVKILLTAIHPEDKRLAKERKRFFIDHWRDWPMCLSKAETAFERDAFQLLKEGQRPYETILKGLSREELSMCFSAFQSFLWNEHVRRLLNKKCQGHVRSHSGLVGDYVFFEKLPTTVYAYLRHLKLPTAAFRMQFPDKLNEIIFEKILTEREITRPMFNKIKLRQAFYKSTSRDVVVKPKDCSAFSHPDYLTLSFTLPRGSYATMLVKCLTVFLEKL